MLSPRRLPAHRGARVSNRRPIADLTDHELAQLVAVYTEQDATLARGALVAAARVLRAVDLRAVLRDARVLETGPPRPELVGYLDALVAALVAAETFVEYMDDAREAGKWVLKHAKEKLALLGYDGTPQ